MVQPLSTSELSPVLPRDKETMAAAAVSNYRATATANGGGTAASTPASAVHASGTANNAHGAAANAGGAVMGGASATSLATKPSLVAHKNMRFLIMDQPKPGNLHLYIRECKRHNVVAVCRVCEPTYSEDEVRAAGIELFELEYDDGGAPPVQIINIWLDLVKNTFNRAVPSSPQTTSTAAAADGNAKQQPCLALHCVAGLGRAPVLVAIALIENGLDPVEAVEFIRKHRRGAINQRQLSYLQQYQRRRKPGCHTCSVM